MGGNKRSELKPKPGLESLFAPARGSNDPADLWKKKKKKKEFWTYAEEEHTNVDVRGAQCHAYSQVRWKQINVWIKRIMKYDTSWN